MNLLILYMHWDNIDSYIDALYIYGWFYGYFDPNALDKNKLKVSKGKFGNGPIYLYTGTS